MRLTLWSAVLCQLALAAEVEAASNTAKNRCSDAMTALGRGPSMHYKGKDIDPTEAEVATAHWNQIAENWNMANKQMKQIPPAELDPKDPELKDCFRGMANYQDYVKELKGKLDRAQADAKLVLPFLTAVKAHEAALLVLVPVHYAPTADVLGGMTSEQAKKVLTELAAVEAACVAPVPSPDGPPPPLNPAVVHGLSRPLAGNVSLPEIYLKKPSLWCGVARNRLALLAQASANRGFMAEGYGNTRILFKEFQSRYDVASPSLHIALATIFSNPADYLRKLDAAQAQWYKELGLPPPQVVASAGEQQAIADLQARVNAVAPQVKPAPGSDHAAAIEKGAAKSLKAEVPTAKVVAVWMNNGDWTVTLNKLGFPIDRYRSGQILFEVPGVKWCQQRTFTYVEAATGVGQFQPSATVPLMQGTQFLACH